MEREIKLKSESKLIFIALNGIGNLILLTPVFTNIKKSLPKSRISVLTLSDSAQALANSPYVDEVLIYPAGKSFAARLNFLLSLRKKKFDVSLYPYPNVNVMSALMGAAIGAKIRVNFAYNFLGMNGPLDTISITPDLEKHDIDKNLGLLRPFKLKIYSKKPFISVAKDDEKYINRLLDGRLGKNDILIGMHVGSKEAMRIWPTENFAFLAENLLREKNIRLALVGTGIEMDLIKDFSEFKNPNIINLIKKTNIPQTTALIRRCRLFITTDSGPMHMAVCAGTRVIAIYLGPHIKRTAPYGKEHIAFVQKQECYASYYKKDKNKNHIYLDKIKPEIVLSRIKKLLKT